MISVVGIVAMGARPRPSPVAVLLAAAKPVMRHPTAKVLSLVVVPRSVLIHPVVDVLSFAARPMTMMIHLTVMIYLAVMYLAR